MRGKETKIALLISRIASKMDGRSVDHLSVINRSRKWKWLEKEFCSRWLLPTNDKERERERAKGQRKDGREKENGYYFTEQISIPFDDLPWPGCITHSDACTNPSLSFQSMQNRSFLFHASTVYRLRTLNIRYILHLGREYGRRMFKN